MRRSLLWRRHLAQKQLLMAHFPLSHGPPAPRSPKGHSDKGLDLTQEARQNDLLNMLVQPDRKRSRRVSSSGPLQGKSKASRRPVRCFKASQVPSRPDKMARLSQSPRQNEPLRLVHELGPSSDPASGQPSKDDVPRRLHKHEQQEQSSIRPTQLETLLASLPSRR